MVVSPHCVSPFLWLHWHHYSLSKKHQSINCTIRYSKFGLWCWFSSCCLCFTHKQPTVSSLLVTPTRMSFWVRLLGNANESMDKKKKQRWKEGDWGSSPVRNQTQIKVCLGGSFWRSVPGIFYGRMPWSHNLGLGLESLAFITHPFIQRLLGH